MPRLARRLRELRELHGLTQEQAADMTGVGYKYYQAVESGKKKQIWLETVARFGEAYGLEIHEFLAPGPAKVVKLPRMPASSSPHYRKADRPDRMPP